MTEPREIFGRPRWNYRERYLAGAAGYAFPGDDVPMLGDGRRDPHAHWSSPRGMPLGLVVGQQPGASSWPSTPMFPWPTGTAGHRLWRLSGIELNEYLLRLDRVNLLREAGPWRLARARAAAELVTEECRAAGVCRVLLCGALVGRAFGLDAYFQPLQPAPLGPWVVAVPHPSGRNRLLNHPENRARTGRAARWAAGVLDMWWSGGPPLFWNAR